MLDGGINLVERDGGGWVIHYRMFQIVLLLKIFANVPFSSPLAVHLLIVSTAMTKGDHGKQYTSSYSPIHGLLDNSE